MTPTAPGAQPPQDPSVVQKLLQFLMGSGALQKAAGQGPAPATPQGTPPFVAPQTAPQGNGPGTPNYMQQQVDAYMKQKQIQDALLAAEAAAPKKKSKAKLPDPTDIMSAPRK